MSSSNSALFKNFRLTKHADLYEIDVFANSEFGIKELRQLIDIQREMGGSRLPVLVLCGEYTTSDVSFLKHLSRNGNDPYSSADAFVIQSIAQKLVANFYIKMVRPERPTKFFTGKDEALKWLRQFM
jgi:dihydroorotase